MKHVLIALITLHAFPSAGWAANATLLAGTNASSDTPQEVRCSECHTCPNPTAANPCLVPCPRPMPAQGPAVVLLNQLSAQYEPVIFAHKLHSQMSEMSGGCAVCHHFNQANRILACRDCHSEDQPKTILEPGLRGAYHRLCLKCHREWNQDTKCSVCHALKTANSAPVVAPDPSDIMGTLHPDVKEPVTKIYQTSDAQGKLVTFRHQEHIQRFGFKCAACHHEDNCGDCHRTKNVPTVAMSVMQHHARCAICHQTTGSSDICAHCHSDEEIPPFTHEQTGLALNEDHQIADCVDCHVDGRFHQEPTCSACHEADVSYPAKLPGTKVKTP